jgi:L-threonine kinase
MKKKIITCKAPGTCGELVQGAIEGRAFHITCPINVFSCVTAEIGSTPGINVNVQEKWKARTAAKETVKLLGENIPLNILISSDIPSGKGMASSTADIVGTCMSVSCLLGKEISMKQVSSIALSIEPSDGIMFKGIVYFDHREGTVMESLGEPPGMKILIVDTGVCIDTLQFNTNDVVQLYSPYQKSMEKAVELVKKGIMNGDISLIGEGATISALCHQDVLFKPELEKIIDIGTKFGAAGVNIAHSGGVIGILLDPKFRDVELLKRRVQEAFKKEFIFYETEIISGGAYCV